MEALFLEVGGKVNANEAARLKEARLNMSKDEILEAEIEKITEEVDKTLQISKAHTEQVKHELATHAAKCGNSSTPSALPSNNNFNEKAPISTEKVEKGLPASDPKVNAEAIIDLTLPQNKPDAPAESETSSSLI